MESRTCIGLSLCHINNLYNTCYWALLHSGLKPEEAEKTIRAKANFSADKHELLFQQFGINYNNEAEQFKKGTVLFKEFVVSLHYLLVISVLVYYNISCGNGLPPCHMVVIVIT
jgi:hypothetical protein